MFITVAPLKFEYLIKNHDKVNPLHESHFLPKDLRKKKKYKIHIRAKYIGDHVN